MEVIMDEVNLEARHVLRWKFRDRSGTLPAGRIVLRVTEDENQWWRFECCRIEGGMQCISGSAWSDFVGPRVHARLTLYAKQDGRYRIYGDEWRRFVGQNREAVVTVYAGEGDNATHRLEMRR
ncbi:hypothetical protein GOBAR_AA16966 [Gossypium barbadense]|uniref:TF-B3 domain-containing protein n=2 Tax=Gossypium TaxID=3633 RepID=A0A2P5XK14_GOSBA|nr:hypothetical protein GOBAR_AA16966 [Gossypium barbadense]TYH23003.1 hypothetical protein ES288_A04G174900v1 [Gossypium darwinii]